MSRVVLLDSGPLGLATHPGGSAGAAECARWLFARGEAGARVVVPDIADYEVRRELVRAGKSVGLARLDALAATAEYLPITTASGGRTMGGSSANREADGRGGIAGTTAGRHDARRSALCSLKNGGRPAISLRSVVWRRLAGA